MSIYWMCGYVIVQNRCLPGVMDTSLSGMGVFQGADVRCVTEHSNLAMPEVRIGFVPDCGGSWFLNRVSNGLGVCSQ